MRILRSVFQMDFITWGWALNFKHQKLDLANLNRKKLLQDVGWFRISQSVKAWTGEAGICLITLTSQSCGNPTVAGFKLPFLAPLIPPKLGTSAISLLPSLFCTQVTCLYLSYKGSWRNEIPITSASFTTHKIWNFSNEKEDPEATSWKEWKMSTMTPFLMSTSLWCQTDTVKWGIEGKFNKGNIFQAMNRLKEIGRDDVTTQDQETRRAITILWGARRGRSY